MAGGAVRWSVHPLAAVGRPAQAGDLVVVLQVKLVVVGQLRAKVTVVMRVIMVRRYEIIIVILEKQKKCMLEDLH